MHCSFRLVSLLLLAAWALAAQSDPPPPQPSEPEAAALELEEVPEAGAEPSRTDLNLLGQVDTESGEARRNENVQIDLVDNNVLKEMNRRVGVTATVVEEYSVDRDYFGAEFGGSPTSPSALPYSSSRDVHGEAFWVHDNSVFRARSFFQVGDVQPARSNDYGATVNLPAWSGAALTFNGQQTRSRGQVNGNVLVPTPEERTPLATEPTLRSEIQRMLDSYPAALPNRTDINPRALNTNAPQEIDNDIAGATLHQELGQDDTLVLRYGFTYQRVDAFQFVGGQNPNASTRNHDARVTWTRAWSPATQTSATLGFDRTGSLLTPDETTFGRTILTSNIFEALGPGTNIPIDRSQNRFRYGLSGSHRQNKHSLIFGGELWRRQVNGAESNANLGMFSFRSDFGNDGITNMRLGLASTFIQTLGSTHRGFRQWEMQYFVGDNWQAARGLNLSYGVRYQPVTAPREVNGLARIPYDCDCNNVAPRFGFAYRPGDRWGVFRGAYGLQYGEIFAVTYGNSRFNTPHNVRIRVPAPDFVRPLGGVDTVNFDPNARGTFFDFAEDLTLPYSHQYNFSWHAPLPSDWDLELGYVGSRSWKLVTLWYFNRGRPVEGIPQITATLNERRADPRYFDVRRALNGGRAYYDAAKITLKTPQRGGMSFETSYWFSKAIDLGSNYANTAAGVDARNSRGQSEFDVHGDMKGLSNFDQPHAWMARFAYKTPRWRAAGSFLNQVVRNWELFGVMLVKTGTPFTVTTGSDGPGFGNVDGSGSDRPNIDDPSILGRSIKHPDTSRSLLPREAFSFIQPTEPRGNIGANTFRKDGIQNLNAAISRSWALASEMRLTLQAESNNVLNRPQFAEPGLEVTAPNFGQITNTLNDGRTFRFQMRLAF